MKGFREQFCECKADGFVGHSEPKRYADYPEWLPAPWHPAAPKFAAALEADPDLSFTETLCLKFGGICKSSNIFCRQIRGCNK